MSRVRGKVICFSWALVKHILTANEKAGYGIQVQTLVVVMLLSASCLLISRWLQGVEISHTTGQVTWDTSLVAPGDYSLQVIVEDLFTGIRVRENPHIVDHMTSHDRSHDIT